jgi:hypothetical protein
MNWSIIPMSVRFQSMFRLEKHSAHVAAPPSFSARIATTSSSSCSATTGSSTGAPFTSAITRRASSVRPLPSRCRGLSGRKKMPESRMRPHSICSPTGIRQDAEPLIVCVPRSMMYERKILRRASAPNTHACIQRPQHTR